MSDDEPTEIEIMARQCRISIDEHYEHDTGSRADASIDNIPCWVTAFGPRLRTPQDLAELLRKLGMEIGEHSQEFNRTAREASPQPESESGCGRVAVNVVATGRAWADGNTARSMAEQERDQLLAERETTRGLVAELETKVKDLIDGHAIERSGLLADLGLCRDELTVARSGNANAIDNATYRLHEARKVIDDRNAEIERLREQLRETVAELGVAKLSILQANDTATVAYAEISDAHRVLDEAKIRPVTDALGARVGVLVQELASERAVTATLTESRDALVGILRDHEVDNKKRIAKIGDLHGEIIKLKADIVRMSEAATQTTAPTTNVANMSESEAMLECCQSLSERLDQVEAWMSAQPQAVHERYMSADLPGKDRRGCR